MDDNKKNLKGSERRDAFKCWHKTLSRFFYACDLDFVFIVKDPPKIAAVLDYKREREQVTFAEVIAYNHLLECKIPIYLISTDPDMPDESIEGGYKSITIRQYLGGDWHPEPPVVETKIIKQNITVAEYEDWEQSIRYPPNNV